MNTDGDDMLEAYRSTLQELKKSPLENTGFDGIKGQYMKRLHEANVTPAEFMKEQVTGPQKNQVYNSFDFLEKMYATK